MAEFVKEIALVVNMQSIGPMFVSDATGLISPDIGMLLAARLVITSGIGNTAAKTLEIYGPLPVPEISENEFLCYLFSSEMKQKPLPGSSFSTGKGTTIFAIMFENKDKDTMYHHQKVLEKIMNKHISTIDFSNSVTGVITPEIKQKSTEVLTELFKEVNEAIIMAEEYKGASLFDIGFVVTLPDELSILAKRLIQHPDGINEEDLIQVSSSSSIEQLFTIGLITKEDRDGKVWITPQ